MPSPRGLKQSSGGEPLLKKLFNFYLAASIHVALAATSLVGVTVLLMPIAWKGSLLGFVFLGTVVSYNFVKYGVEAHKYLVVFKEYYKIIRAFSFCCLGGALYFLSHLSKESWVVVGLSGLLSTLYAVPFLPGTRNLRSLGGLKIYVVALVWTGITVLLPLVEAQYPVTREVWILLAQRFMLVLVLLFPFEIRDLARDDKKLNTLPQVLGIKNTQRLGVVLVGICFAATLLKQEVTLLEIIMRAVLSVLLLVALAKSAEQSPCFAAFWVEGIPIGWGILLGLADWFF